MSERLLHDHRELLECVARLIDHLRDLRYRLDSGNVAHHQHLVFAERANSFAIFLEAAAAMVRADFYMPAFGALRSVLEHHVIDILMFLGRRYVRVVKGVDDTTWQRWQAERDSGAEWTEDIVDWSRHKETVTIIRSGPHVRGEKPGPRGESLSIYFFLLQDFDPFVGQPSQQQFITSGFMEPDVYVTVAKRNQDLYRYAMKWSALKDNLRVNGLYSLSSTARLDIHYSFLSAFVHPTLAGYELVYGSRLPEHSPRYNHYVAELALLYCLALARAEILAFDRMSRRNPKVRIGGWPEIRDDLESARMLSSHLWFPPDGKPHDYDRYVESNRRLTHARGKARPSIQDLRSLADRSIRYYRNPLQRLKEMHQSTKELTTGLSYRSPWEQSD